MRVVLVLIAVLAGMSWPAAAQDDALALDDRRLSVAGYAATLDGLRAALEAGRLEEARATAVALRRKEVVWAGKPLAPDPTNLFVDRDGADLLLDWDDPGQTSSWNVYREPSPDPSGWGLPHAPFVTDEDPVAEGVQHRDVGAVSAGPLLFYRVTANNFCGESPLN